MFSFQAGLWTVFTLGGVGSKATAAPELSSPLANQSLLLLLVLANLTDAADAPNPYRQAIMSFKNTQGLWYYFLWIFFLMRKRTLFTPYILFIVLQLWRWLSICTFSYWWEMRITRSFCLYSQEVQTNHRWGLWFHMSIQIYIYFRDNQASLCLIWSFCPTC